MGTTVKGDVSKTEDGMCYTIEINTDSQDDAAAAYEIIRDPKTALAYIKNGVGGKGNGYAVTEEHLSAVMKQAKILKSFRAEDNADGEMVELATALNTIGIRLEKTVGMMRGE